MTTGQEQTPATEGRAPTQPTSTEEPASRKRVRHDAAAAPTMEDVDDEKGRGSTTVRRRLTGKAPDVGDDVVAVAL